MSLFASIHIQGAGVLKFYYTTLNINKKDFNDSRNALLQLEIMEDTQNLNFLKIDLSLSKFLREKIVKISKSDQLPQLFLDDQFIAGFEELCNWVENDKFFENITLSGYRQRMN